jgi:Skp family chaperone for outer membrane proteins
MKMLLKAALLATAPIAFAAPTLVSAQATTNVGVANLDEAVQKSNAYVAAIAQIRTAMKPQIDQFEARSKALNTEIQPLVTAFQTAQRAPNANQQALQTQATAIQTKQQAAQRELQQLYLPVGRAQAYVEEQIVGKLDGALKAAMTKNRVSLVVRPEATISYQPATDITAAITAELNTAAPSVSITPPAGWQPAGQAGQQGAAPAPAARPQGR